MEFQGHKGETGDVGSTVRTNEFSRKIDDLVEQSH